MSQINLVKEFENSITCSVNGFFFKLPHEIHVYKGIVNKFIHLFIFLFRCNQVQMMALNIYPPCLEWT